MENYKGDGKYELLPSKCPNCNGQLKSYHTSGETRRICSNKCQGFKTIVFIDHKRKRFEVPVEIAK